ncbi:MAG: 4-diphosphocytidyl-2-C-methyl-D-erythritol kinase [Candidatus Peregrinibacteria bacterium GW2011_GWA2_47_7]|nr:MAG: 4-diphosphocytidyl-2-C-methyl-D-erythritol kinase [Candidatus Peregrinibacteria bacterium GW2011_GWA2_47_7]
MNRNATLRAPAKINLALDILRKDPSGYHEIRTVLQEVPSLADIITLEEGANYGDFDIEFPNAPEHEEDNTVKTALALLKKDFPDTPSVYIAVHKNIPMQSGLGGGSSDAAAVLKQLGEWWKIPHEELMKIAEKIGMDCPFFLYGGTALDTHFGEKITPLPPLPQSVNIEVIDTGITVSTRDAYTLVDISRCNKNTSRTDTLIAALHAGDTNAIIQNARNDFEEFIFAAHPELLAKKLAAEKEKPGRIMLCGSGGALVSLTKALNKSSQDNTSRSRLVRLHLR